MPHSTNHNYVIPLEFVVSSRQLSSRTSTAWWTRHYSNGILLYSHNII